jgi:hypothetical protein
MSKILRLVLFGGVLTAVVGPLRTSSCIDMDFYVIPPELVASWPTAAVPRTDTCSLPDGRLTPPELAWAARRACGARPGFLGIASVLDT